MRNWHRWIGLGAALFLLSVSTTGVLLQLNQFFADDEETNEKLGALESNFNFESSYSQFGPTLERSFGKLKETQGNQKVSKIDIQLKGEHPLLTVYTEGPSPKKITLGQTNDSAEKIEDYEGESFLLRLHTGEILGDGGVILGIFWGLALIGLTITGACLYWQIYKVRAKKYGWKKVF